MKLFTHVLVIYQNGWVFKWEPKETQKPLDIAKTITSLVTTGLVFALIEGALA